jgi:hypothetical protein
LQQTQTGRHTPAFLFVFDQFLVKLTKWALYNQTPKESGFEGFREIFAESNGLIYTRDMDATLSDLWGTATSTHETIAAANMERWWPADIYFHFAAFSTVWFFSLHMRQSSLCDVDMHCTRFSLPLARGKIRQEAHAISVVFYLTGVLPADVDLMRTLFPGAEVEGNELTIYAD